MRGIEKVVEFFGADAELFGFEGFDFLSRGWRIFAVVQKVVMEC